jgi:hypothetical protein
MHLTAMIVFVGMKTQTQFLVKKCLPNRPQVKLDRETRANYTLILDVSDLGIPPQQTSRLLTVVVTDIDDHAPEFNRQKVPHFKVDIAYRFLMKSCLFMFLKNGCST